MLKRKIMLFSISSFFLASAALANEELIPVETVEQASQKNYRGNDPGQILEIPSVPVRVMKKPAAEPVNDALAQSKSGSSSSAREPSELVLSPGVNQVFSISLGHANRIVTPFPNPQVTSSNLRLSKDGVGEVMIQNNVIYVTTAKTTPATMFVTNKGSESQALSVTMIPRRIPPREVFLKLDASSSSIMVMDNKEAEAWETSQPYVETIVSTFRHLAKQEVPRGYTLGEIPNNLSLPYCKMPHVSISFRDGQYLNGHNLSVLVGVATNNSDKPLEFEEERCGAWNVAAVTVWPDTVLMPGQKTEVYFAIKKRTNGTVMSKRPSLVGG